MTRLSDRSVVRSTSVKFKRDSTHRQWDLVCQERAVHCSKHWQKPSSMLRRRRMSAIKAPHQLIDITD